MWYTWRRSRIPESILRAAAVLVSLIALACSAEQLRSATYPPDFHYITRTQIRGVMGGLAVRMGELESLMRDETDADLELEPQERERVIALLSEMQSLALDLKRGTRSNHPSIDRYAPELREDLHRALRGVKAEPPNYYYAGQVAGSCEYCHAPPQLAPAPGPKTPRR